MIFSSLTFLIFFSIVLILLAVGRKNETFKKVLLLASSYFFYGWWDWRFLSLIIFSTLLDYFCGKLIDQSKDEKKRKRLLILSLVGNLGLLFVFKYFNFFIDNLNLIFSQWGWKTGTLHIILPVGISFYTFQTLSYTIDIYRKKLKHEESILDVALFVGFFPQLVAGPIVRAIDFLPQLKEKILLKTDNFRIGGQIFLLGMVKKLLIADILSIYVDEVFKNPSHYNGGTLWLGVLAYAIQIYCDFSGYSDMAIGSARIMGFDLKINFLFPYISRNVTEFWHRWHVSLSTWLRDYLYIPLGGNRKGQARTYINLLITMLLGGLWHGANWTFVAWGALHGLALAAEKAVLKKEGKKEFSYKSRIDSVFDWLLTFLFVLVGWVFFRCQTIGAALVMIRRMFTWSGGGAFYYYQALTIILPLVALYNIWGINKKEEYIVLDMDSPLHYIAIGAIVLALLFLHPSSTQPFIYFQF